MAQVISINKPIGLTPLQAINQLKLKDPILKNKKLTYAGRLDPMAEGLVLLLDSPDQITKQKYLKLDKTYQFKLFFGVSTDTYDILGLTQPSRTDLVGKQAKTFSPSRTDLEGVLKTFVGCHLQSYPPYSSKTVKGKPLFYYARTNQLSTIKIPKKKIKITSLKLISSQFKTKAELKKQILQSIELVKGDFRQPQIIKSWQKYFFASAPSFLKVYNLEFKCSSGTYVRSLVHQIGKKLNIPAVTLSIKRTKIGPYLLKNATTITK